jgi:UDP-N-acetylmuramoylalanine--D-glutamate ligase
MDFADRHIAVVGLGGSGLAAARYLAAHGARVVVADSKPAPERVAELQRHVPDAELRVGAFDASTFAGVDMLVLSPGVPLKTRPWMLSAAPVAKWWAMWNCWPAPSRVMPAR